MVVILSPVHEISSYLNIGSLWVSAGCCLLSALRTAAFRPWDQQVFLCWQPPAWWLILHVLQPYPCLLSFGYQAQQVVTVLSDLQELVLCPVQSILFFQCCCSTTASWLSTSDHTSVRSSGTLWSRHVLRRNMLPDSLTNSTTSWAYSHSYTAQIGHKHMLLYCIMYVFARTERIRTWNVCAFTKVGGILCFKDILLNVSLISFTNCLRPGNTYPYIIHAIQTDELLLNLRNQ